MSLLKQEFTHFNFQSTAFNHNLLQFEPQPTIHIHHNGHHHFLTSSSVTGKVIIYDSLTSQPTHDLYKQLARIYSPDYDVIPDIYQSVVANKQQGSRDCGIFALAYATELAHGFDPSNFIFDQSKMRDHLFKCLENNRLTRFPKTLVLNHEAHLKKLNTDVRSSNRWTSPKKTVKSFTRTSHRTSFKINTRNRYSALSQESSNSDNKNRH